MNKEDIIKALECCTADFCVGCPLSDKEPNDCANELNSEIICFIEHQEYNIRYLKKQLEIADKETQAAHKTYIAYVIECEERRKKSLEKLSEDIKAVVNALPSSKGIMDRIDELTKKAIGNKSNTKESE